MFLFCPLHYFPPFLLFVLHLFLLLHLSPTHAFTLSHIWVPMLQTSCLFYTHDIPDDRKFYACSENCKKWLYFIMSVCPCAWDNLAPNGQIFMKFGYLSIFPKSVQRIEISLKSDKKINSSTLHEDQYIFFIISCSLLLRMRNASSKVVEKIKTRTLLCTIIFLEKCALYEMCGKIL